jgi:hypothetical protein
LESIFNDLLEFYDWKRIRMKYRKYVLYWACWVKILFIVSFVVVLYVVLYVVFVLFVGGGVIGGIVMLIRLMDVKSM